MAPSTIHTKVYHSSIVYQPAHAEDRYPTIGLLSQCYARYLMTLEASIVSQTPLTHSLNMDPLPLLGSVLRRPTDDCESPAESCWKTIRSLRVNESVQADIDAEEKMPGSEESMPGLHSGIPGPTSVTAFPRPPRSPRPRARRFPPQSHHTRERSDSPSYHSHALPPAVPNVEEDYPGSGFTVGWNPFPDPPELRPAPPYQQWHPTSVLFEYLHVRGFMNSGRFENDGDYPVVPKRMVHLCRWFNHTPLQKFRSEKAVWRDHLDRVDWLQWYWNTRERNRAIRWKERDDLTTDILRAREARARELVAKAKSVQEAERLIEMLDKGIDNEEERELDDIMDLDLSPESSEDAESNEGGVGMGDGEQNGQSTPNSREHEASQSTASTGDQQSEERELRFDNGNHLLRSRGNPTRNRDNHIGTGIHNHHMANGNNQRSNGHSLVENRNHNHYMRNENNPMTNGHSPLRNGHHQNGNQPVSNGADHRRRGEHRLENGNHQMGNGNRQMENGDEDAGSRWETLTVNHEGEEDPEGLTQKDWDLAIGMDEALEIREGAPMEEVVRETVLWAIDVHEIGQRWKRERSHENDDDEPVHRRIGQIRQTW